VVGAALLAALLVAHGVVLAERSEEAVLGLAELGSDGAECSRGACGAGRAGGRYGRGSPPRTGARRRGMGRGGGALETGFWRHRVRLDVQRLDAHASSRIVLRSQAAGVIGRGRCRCRGRM
jgi:hypothetical protein